MGNGGVVFDGNVRAAISQYLEIDARNNDLKSNFNKLNKLDSEAEILNGSIEDIHGCQKIVFDMFEEKFISMHFRIKKNLKGVTPIIQIVRDGEIILNSFLTDGHPSFLDGFDMGEFNCKLKIPFPLKEGRYSIHMRIGKLKVADIDFVENALTFDVENTQLNIHNLSFSKDRPGIFPIVQKWEIC
jgi:hypothetical protein